MAIFANEFPADFEPGSDFVQIEDEEFALASEPGGLIAIEIDNDQGYLTLVAAKRLLSALTTAIANSETSGDEWNIEDAREGKYEALAANATDDDKIPF